MKSIVSWLRQVSIAIDQLANAIIGGWADETLSSCAYRMELDGRLWGKVFRPLIDALFFFQPNHCKLAFDGERQRLQSPPELRQ